MKKNSILTQTIKQTEAGFTIVEVMLVLGIAGLMLVGLIGGTFASIARQRYNDSINDFAEYLSRIYSEVASPKTFGAGASSEAILGKVLVFGYKDNDPSVYSVTLAGDVLVGYSDNASFMDELMSERTKARLVCGDSSRESSVEAYTPLWEASLRQANDIPNYPGKYTAEFDRQFKGTIIIARTPSSSAVHTIYAPELTYNLEEECTTTNHNASTQFNADLAAQRADNPFRVINYYNTEAVGICIKSDNSTVSREIRIAADGRNTSAIWVRDTDDGDNRCEL